MQMINLGSLNLDKVYQVEHFVTEGETIAASRYTEFCGGKGLNQSVALARAGARVAHVGRVGADGAQLVQVLRDAGCDTRFVQTVPGPSGHAIVQLTPAGQNCIIVSGGANHSFTNAAIDAALDAFAPGALLLLQNETNGLAHAMRAAHRRGFSIALNPAPFTPGLLGCPLELVDYFIVNEVEAQALAATQTDDFELLAGRLRTAYPRAHFFYTVGSKGAYYFNSEHTLYHGTYSVPVADTTGAGDTFCGYALACLAQGHSPKEALRCASLASSLAVSRQGASPSIPTMAEVEQAARRLQLVKQR